MDKDNSEIKVETEEEEQYEPSEIGNLHHIPPTLAQVIKRNLGQFGGNSGVNKMFFMSCVIDTIAGIVKWDKIADRVTKEIDRLKEYEERTGNKMIFRDIKNWNHLFDKYNMIRERLWKIQRQSETIKSTKKIDKSDIENVKDYKELIRLPAHYQSEIYFLFITCLEFTNIQMTPIPGEYFRSTPEMQQYDKTAGLKATSHTSKQGSSMSK